jgi:hypothetical protein
MARRSALSIVKHMRNQAAMAARHETPWFLGCPSCEGTGERVPPRADWDLLPNTCGRCAGSGRVEIPLAELFSQHTRRRYDYEPPSYKSPEVKGRPPNRKARKGMKR